MYGISDGLDKSQIRSQSLGVVLEKGGVQDLVKMFLIAVLFLENFLGHFKAMSYVCSQMSPQIFKRTGQAISN